VVDQLALRTIPPAISPRGEQIAVIHLPAIDVQRDRRVIRQCIGEYVVLKGWNQAAGIADPGTDPPLFSEPKAALPLLLHVVLSHVEPPLYDALDTPDSGVIMQRCLLARTPGHDHDRVAGIGIAMKQTPGIAILARSKVPLG